MIDAVVGYHWNPATCGVAKFDRQLANALGVPWVRWDCYAWRPNVVPLVSVKWSELTPRDACHFHDKFIAQPFDLLAHDHPHPDLAKAARRVFHASAVGCPSTIQGNPHRGTYRVLTFGMAHKLVLPHFQALKARLDWEHPDYTLSLSTAVHEGSPWDTALTDAEASMRAIFGDKLRVLGFLADDALARELQECDAVAAYFVPAVRANNTSIWAAVEAGKTIYTNTDEHSPDLTKPPTWERLAEVFRA